MIIYANLFFERQTLKFELINQKSIPDVGLVNYFSIDSKNIISGGVLGFVKFNNKNDQPKTLKQYIKIEALDQFDSKGAQLFSYQDIVKMEYLPPKYFDTVFLKVINITNDRITLSDKDNNLFFIDKVTKEVGMFDSTGDRTKLITSDFKYTEFMREFLR